MNKQVSVASAAVKDENLFASFEVSRRQAFAVLKLRVVICGKLKNNCKKKVAFSFKIHTPPEQNRFTQVFFHFYRTTQEVQKYQFKPKHLKVDLQWDES